MSWKWKAVNSSLTWQMLQTALYGTYNIKIRLYKITFQVSVHVFLFRGTNRLKLLILSDVTNAARRSLNSKSDVSVLFSYTFSRFSALSPKSQTPFLNCRITVRRARNAQTSPAVLLKEKWISILTPGAGQGRPHSWPLSHDGSQIVATPPTPAVSLYFLCAFYSGIMCSAI